MAQLDENPLWKDVKQEGPSLQDRLLGPSANYLAGVKPPSEQGVNDSGDLGQVFTNSRAAFGYVDNLVKDAKGNQSFVETGGMCKTPEGKVVPRWSYINNRMGAGDVLPSGVASALGGNFNGLIPGMFGDIAALNPITTLNALMLDGVPPCEQYTCPTMDSVGRSGSETHYMTPKLESSMGPCRPASEGFSGQFASFAPKSGPYRAPKLSETPSVLLWGLAIAGLVAVTITFRRNS